jgi:hypothetical protein
MPREWFPGRVLPLYFYFPPVADRARSLSMHASISRCVILLTVVALAACGAFNPTEKQRTTAVEDFMYALRWHRFQEAAAFFTSEHRRAFLDQMEGLRDLNVTDVRLQRAEPADEGRRVETRLEMDYYLLPSATLKTLRIDQTWIYSESGDAAGKGFLITTPFPKFP